MESDLVPSLLLRVDVGRLRADVARLAQGERHSLHSPERHAKTVDYISAVFDECGLATRHHTHDFGGRRCVNIVGLKAGFSPQGLRPLLVSAHYDTVLGSPGADDNASGVAALLECAQVLSTVRLHRNIEFVAFDMEEKQPSDGALVGSNAFVKHVQSNTEGAADGKKAYEGQYNLEMVGYTSGPGTQGHPPGFRLIMPTVYKKVQQWDFRGDFIAIAAPGAGIELSRRFEAAARQWVPELKVLAIEVKHQIPVLLDIFRSDHYPFWRAGIPAIMLTDTANFRNPHYHKPTDTLDTLDYTFMGNVTRALVATLVQHATPG